ncbi:MAG TPA: RNB domain-containing ribonuclease [Opitutaceae bacterium]|nr:RNB domain-containing ribonuclease [Opitutaceae bacterium]
MPSNSNTNQRSRLREIAFRVMQERGLAPDFSPAAVAELAAIRGPAARTSPSTRDMRALPWCSIDNDDSRDLDQLSVSEPMPDGAVRLLVAIAGVAALVRQGSALDAHARQNTTSVYTAGAIFPMLPERLSTDLTSLGFGVDRVAVIIDMTFGRDGSMAASDIYEGLVTNKAKLAYDSVAAWLVGTGPMPKAIGAVAGLDENIRIQHRAAQQLRALRHMRGALSLQTIQARPVFVGEMLQDLKPDESNVAKNLIEELMVAANGVAARYLEAKGFPSVRRVVRTPAKWDRIVEIAAAAGSTLPGEPDGKALEQFLLASMKADPVHFPDLSLCVIKLLGRGEYVIELPGGSAPGHFGLAVKDYAHSTAPNRRFPDLLIQRLLKAALAGAPPPYGNAELSGLARHCTEQEEAAKKVERQLAKSAAAMLLSTRIRDKFDAVVTGVADSGTWVRIFHPPVEGKLEKGFEGRKVGDRLRVQLVFADVERGYIDFVAAA